MEKLIWEKPEMKEEAFAANDCVNACLYAVCTMPLPEYNDDAKSEYCFHHSFLWWGVDHNHYQGADGGHHWDCTCGSGISYDPANQQSKQTWLVDSKISSMYVDATPDVANDEVYKEVTDWSHDGLMSLFANAVGGKLSAIWTATTKYLGIDFTTHEVEHKGYITYDGRSASHS